MSTLLHIEASPRKERSASLEVARAFLTSYTEQHPEDTVVTVDLWSESLPEFDGDLLDAKYRILHGQEHTAEEAKAWESVVKTAEPLKTADKVVVSTPMWNFGIPYKLKHYLDVVIQPGVTFSFSPDTGYQGLVEGKAALVIVARGGSYEGDMAAMDFQKPYIEQALGFIGFTDVRSLVVGPTLGLPDDTASVRAKAVEEAVRMAASF